MIIGYSTSIELIYQSAYKNNIFNATGTFSTYFLKMSLLKY